MKDFIGRSLEVDDHVAVMEPGYRNLVLGRIKSFTPKMVNVTIIRSKSTQNYRVYSSDLVKLNGPEFTQYLLSKKNL